MKTNHYYSNRRLHPLAAAPVYRCIFVDKHFAVLLDVTAKYARTYNVTRNNWKHWREMRQVVSYMPKGS